MKKLFTLIALVASMSMNAQTVKVMKVLDGENEVATCKVKQTVKVVFVDVPITGKATRTGNVEVNWVQLWENGPKFAEYNVGAGSKTETGGYYVWGGSVNRSSRTDYNQGNEVLSGDNDTATKLWGEKWRMPTKEEFDALVANCDVAWTENYNQSGLKGRVFTGKGDYASNSVFFPAAGYYTGIVNNLGYYGFYWSSTPKDSNNAYTLGFHPTHQGSGEGGRNQGYPVRPVLKE